MLEHLLGRQPRVTAYFGGLAVGLSLVVAGFEAARLRVVGPLSPTAFAGYAAVGLSAGFLLAFVASYLNGSLVAGWLTGAVPATGRFGARLLDGSLNGVPSAIVVVLGVGLVTGGVGFVVATESHRRDANSGDVPPPPARAEGLLLTALSVAAGLASLVAVDAV